MTKKLSFKGNIIDNGQQRINLRTKKGKVGYKIVKFQLMAIDPIGNNQESVVKIYKEEQSSIDENINFGDNMLIGAGYLENDNSGATPTFNEAAIIFDNEIINQDIYLTHVEQGSDSVNYYIELESMPLTDLQATDITLKALRSIAE